jgi:exopolysaccharide biosynthesis polyprenyl glycosylphosphotransferase
MLTTRPNLESNVGVLPILKPRPRPARFGAGWSFLLFGIDLAAVALAVYSAHLVTHADLSTLVRTPEALQTVMFAGLLWVLVFERIGMYRRSFSLTARDEVYASLAASTLSLAPAFGIFLFDPALREYRDPLVVSVLLAAVAVSLARYAAHAARRVLSPRIARRIAVVGSPERVKALPGDLSLFESDHVVRMPIEFFDDDIATSIEEDRIADISWLRNAIERGCNEVIVTEALPPAIMPELLRLTESHGIKLAFAPMRIRPYACDFSVRRDGGLTLLYPRRLAICTPGADFARRTFDLALTTLALTVVLPLMALISLAVYLDSGGPALYRQVRTGRGGVPFEIFKFRTMAVDAESDSGPVWAKTNESRTTRIGRFLRRTSLDELPQFFNVLRGEMSLVGPRPERPFYVEQFRKMLPRYEERHLVRPGITGWSHIHMKRDVDTSAIGERLSYDLFYLEHWSIYMDILILCKTAAEFLFHSAA